MFVSMINQAPDYCSQNPDPMCWQKQTVRKVKKVALPSEPSDGVVPLSSQILNGADRNEFVRNTSVSHFAEPGNENVWGVIGEQIQTLTAPNPVFIIENCEL